MRIIAVILDPPIITRILTHIGEAAGTHGAEPTGQHRNLPSSAAEAEAETGAGGDGAVRSLGRRDYVVEFPIR